MEMKILVLEDRINHQNDAKECIVRIKGEISFTFTSKFSEAVKQLGLYDGVISDVFQPREPEDDVDVKEFDFLREKDDVEEELDYLEELPYGALLVKKALEKGIPSVLISDAYHHGSKLKRVYHWSSRPKIKAIPLIDNYLEGGKKRWLEAILTLIWIIKEVEKGILIIESGRLINENEKLFLNSVDYFLELIAERKPLIEELKDEFFGGGALGFSEIVKTYLLP